MTFLASVGSRVRRYELDGAGLLHAAGSVDLGSPVHYAWPHPLRRRMLVACSWSMVSPLNQGHRLCQLEVPAESGLRSVGKPITLPHRPIHLTVDPQGSFVFVLFNDPPGLQVHALQEDGSIGATIPQRRGLDLGVYPHQVRVSPCGRWVLVSARGNDAHAGRPEDPGGLYRFDLGTDGRLVPAQVVAPEGGFGFGPRHLDFHPTQPCIYVSLERQNQLQVFRHRDGMIEERPWQVLDTIAPRKLPRFEQFAGAVHVHPAGSFVYVANRDDLQHGHEASHLSGDNSIAVFRIDPATGGVTLAGHCEPQAFHVRTFSLCPPFLVTASVADVQLREPSGTRHVPASLGVFRIGDDGMLVPLHHLAQDTGGSLQFWSGFPQAYGSRWPPGSW